MTEDREKVNQALTTAARHARRAARNTLRALQNRFSELAAELETVVDSGAAEFVAPVVMALLVPRQESDGSKWGHLSTSGGKLPNTGEKTVDNPSSRTLGPGDIPVCSGDEVCDTKGIGWCLRWVEATWSTSRAGRGRTSRGRMTSTSRICTCGILEVVPRKWMLAGRRRER